LAVQPARYLGYRIMAEPRQPMQDLQPGFVLLLFDLNGERRRGEVKWNLVSEP
jgi:hypothetical protein